ANGGAGGNLRVDIGPVAISGSSGAVTAQSSATNTGATGAATSSATSNPQATSGDSGQTGRSGPAQGTAVIVELGLIPAVINTDAADGVAASPKASPLGGAAAATVARSGRSGDSGGTGDATARGGAVSSANSG